jgi:peptidoglycan/LPS O-acetylase OafA/YrhL
VVSHSAPLLAPLANTRHFGKITSVFLTVTQPLGLLGVELFFVLSGFLIGNILIKTFVNSSDFSFGTVRNFWIRRWFRTLPNYWLILTVDIILYKVLNLTTLDAGKLLFYPFLQNLWYPQPLFFFGESWSLSIEEWFYLTLPIAMYMSYRIFSTINKKTFLLKVFSIYLLVFLLARFFNAFHPISGPDQDMGIRKVVVFRLDAVMYGVLFAYFNYYNSTLLNRIKYYLLAISAMGTIFIYYLMVNPRINICAPSNPALKFFSDAFLYLLIPLFLSFCLPFANGIKNMSGKYIGAVIQHVSKISYSMYLVHYSLIFAPLAYFLKVDSYSILVAVYVLYWVVVMVLSSLLYKYFEYPVMGLRDKIGPSRPPQGEVRSTELRHQGD